MKKLFCMLFILSIYGSVENVTAQVTYHPKNPPTKSESELDKQVLACVEGQDIFEDNFSFSEWTSELHYYARKMLQRLSSEHVSQIAIQKDRVAALHQVLGQCTVMSPVATELEAIHKIYQEEITYEKSAESTGLFADEEIKASMDTKDAEDLVKRLEKLRKKLSISRVIIRIQ